MSEPSVGIWLRRERERRGMTLRQIADQTKVAAPLLAGLESGDLSRWPGGIYRRAFVKSYATALRLDTDEVVKRFELEHPPEPVAPVAPELSSSSVPTVAAARAGATGRSRLTPVTRRARLLGTAADLAVALVLGLGSAAAGSRLLWPVLLIALYYAVGVIMTGTSPMVALLLDSSDSLDAAELPDGAPLELQMSGDEEPKVLTARQIAERRHQSRRGTPRPQRAARGARGARLQ